MRDENVMIRGNPGAAWIPNFRASYSERILQKKKAERQLMKPEREPAESRATEARTNEARASETVIETLPGNSEAGEAVEFFDGEEFEPLPSPPLSYEYEPLLVERGGAEFEPLNIDLGDSYELIY